MFSKSQKKRIRILFRDRVFKRDNHTCKTCGSTDNPESFDAHHITDRNEMPNGGYALENGITLCSECHIKAETEHSTGIPVDGYSKEELYKLINSSYNIAYEASERLKV